MNRKYRTKSLRTFIGAKDFQESRMFYKELGYTETIISDDMVLITVNDNLCFYLQDYYVKDWINNFMMFLEVDDVDKCYEDVKARNFDKKYKTVRLSRIKSDSWGREFFLHDPSGVLWHFGQFD